MSIWPPIIFLILQAIGFGLECGKYPSSIFGTMCASSVLFALLWWGNFFAPLGF